jgi:hypothetical protein
LNTRRALGPRGAAATILFAWAWICGCDVTGLPHGAQRFSPPAQYRAWWALTEACSGVRGNFNAVTWYTVPNTNTFSLEGEAVNGAWYGGHDNRIVLGDSAEFVGSLVRHEMLHALLQVSGHPRQQFLGNCSDIVVCIEQCVSDAGGPPDTSQTAALLGPALLPAAVLLAPDTVSMSVDSGWSTITISITNMTNAPARVAVDTSYGFPLSLILWRSQPGWNDVAYEDQSDYYYLLAPADSAGSTRRVVFDQQVPFTSTPPQYIVTGFFAQSVAAAQTLTVAP